MVEHDWSVPKYRTNASLYRENVSGSTEPRMAYEPSAGGQGRRDFWPGSHPELCHRGYRVRAVLVDHLAVRNLPYPETAQTFAI